MNLLTVATVAISIILLASYFILRHFFVKPIISIMDNYYEKIMANDGKVKTALEERRENRMLKNAYAKILKVKVPVLSHLLMTIREQQRYEEFEEDAIFAKLCEETY